MTIASDYIVESDATAEPSYIMPAAIVLGLIAAWVAATVLKGFDGFIAGADVTVLLAFAAILRATRL